MKKQQKDLDELDIVIEQLQRQKTLPKRYQDHPLTGNWQGYRECHLAPDWLLIYKIMASDSCLRLARTGSHAELFR